MPPHLKVQYRDGDLVTAAFGPVPRTFTHRDAAGNVLADGTWEPTAVLSYRSFGPATPEQEAEFGGLPPGSEGGKVMIKVALFVGGVHVHDGIIIIVCLLGQPPKNAAESTLLLVQGTHFNFNEVVSGDNIFIRLNGSESRSRHSNGDPTRPQMERGPLKASRFGSGDRSYSWRSAIGPRGRSADRRA